jgi:archaellum biogenesis ATPase FlaH
MDSPNNHITEFLSYYCSIVPSPGYAVLLKGRWGAGKTWFIREFFKNQVNDKYDYLYVSLYGIKSYEEVENEFFRQIHPILSSRSARLLGKLTKGLLKATIHLDLDDDKKSDVDIGSGLPNEKLFEKLKISEEKILVFDDLERCAIPIPEILGYINQLVEHSDFKVIVIANEHEIIKADQKPDDNSLTQYIRIKEKLIGKTFEISPELTLALDKFISQLQNDDARQEISKNKRLYRKPDKISLSTFAIKN